MKNIIFFMTHKTLTLDHAKATFYSISKQNTDKKFDILYLYNTHQDEISNDVLLNLYSEYGLDRFIKEVKIFDYNPFTPKTLGNDLDSIIKYCVETYENQDRILFLKSDIVLSKNYFDDALNVPNGQLVYYTSPFICAKARISDAEIFEYADRDTYIQSDDITFFVEDQYGSPNNDFNNRPGVSITDEQIKFTSCYVIFNFTCHMISVELLKSVNLDCSSWGGATFTALYQNFVGTNRSFAIHKFHGIISENRATDREGPVKDWLYS